MAQIHDTTYRDPSGLEVNTPEPQIGSPKAYPRTQEDKIHYVPQSVPSYSDAGHLYGEWPPGSGDKRICGLRRMTFFLLIALACLIIAGAVGGGVGGSIAANNNKNASSASSATVTITASPTATPLTTSSSSPSSTTSSSPTTTSAIRVPTSGILFLDCPALDGQTIDINAHNARAASSFHLTCGGDFTSSTSLTLDILAITAYSVQDCLRACAGLNANLQGGGNGAGRCVAAVFNNNLAQVQANGGTCWLKNGTGSATVDGGNGSVGATLL